jgi:tetratricopeptide (TPR) repeat protein
MSEKGNKEENKDIFKSKGVEVETTKEEVTDVVEEITDTNEELVEETNAKQSILSAINLEDFLGEKTYDFYLNNKKLFIGSTASLLFLVIAWFAYNVVWHNYVVIPANEKSIEDLWQAEHSAFDKADWNTAINGDSLNTFDGFKDLAEEHSGTSGGEIATYELGISYLNNEQYEEAIKTLKQSSFDDELIGTITLGAIGDAYMQLGNVTDAYNSYKQAYLRRDNVLTTPIYMMKAAGAKEIEGDYKEAILIYEELVQKYPSSNYSISAEKYLESLKLESPVYSTK